LTYFLNKKGQDELSGLRPHLYQDTDVFLVCFSFDNLSSIESINDKWYFELQKLCPNAKKILVGTKLDTKSVSELAPNNKYSSSVTNEQVESLKRKLKFDHYFGINKLLLKLLKKLNDRLTI
jgi:GTPase SAR1 family protein